jgi:hypothetical protein
MMKIRERLPRWILEALIGLALAVLAVVVSWATSGQVPFVYRGL